MIEQLKWLKEPGEWKYPVTLVAIAGLCALFIYATWPAAYNPPQSHVVCLMFDISTPDGRARWKGWHPVPPGKREEISLMVNAGAMEWMEALTADCYERNADNPDFGNLVRREYVEWYRWVEKPKKPRLVITH